MGNTPSAPAPAPVAQMEDAEEVLAALAEELGEVQSKLQLELNAPRQVSDESDQPPPSPSVSVSVSVSVAAPVSSPVPASSLVPAAAPPSFVNDTSIQSTSSRGNSIFSSLPPAYPVPSLSFPELPLRTSSDRASVPEILDLTRDEEVLASQQKSTKERGCLPRRPPKLNFLKARKRQKPSPLYRVSKRELKNKLLASGVVLERRRAQIGLELLQTASIQVLPFVGIPYAEASAAPGDDGDAVPPIEVQIEDVESARRIALEEYSQPYLTDPRRHVVWTDASKRHSVGLGVVHESFNDQIQRTVQAYRIEVKGFNSNLGEALAIAQGLHVALMELQVRKQPVDVVVVYSDGRAQLEDLKRYLERDRHIEIQRDTTYQNVVELAVRKATEFRQYSKHVILRWVPGHMDVPGNLLADKAAGKASEDPAGSSEAEAIKRPVTESSKRETAGRIPTELLYRFQLNVEASEEERQTRRERKIMRRKAKKLARMEAQKTLSSINSGLNSGSKADDQPSTNLTPIADMLRLGGEEASRMRRMARVTAKKEAEQSSLDIASIAVSSRQANTENIKPRSVRGVQENITSGQRNALANLAANSTTCQVNGGLIFKYGRDDAAIDDSQNETLGGPSEEITLGSSALRPIDLEDIPDPDPGTNQLAFISGNSVHTSRAPVSCPPSGKYHLVGSLAPGSSTANPIDIEELSAGSWPQWFRCVPTTFVGEL